MQAVQRHRTRARKCNGHSGFSAPAVVSVGGVVSGKFAAFELALSHALLNEDAPGVVPSRIMFNKGASRRRAAPGSQSGAAPPAGRAREPPLLTPPSARLSTVLEDSHHQPLCFAKPKPPQLLVARPRRQYKAVISIISAHSCGLTWRSTGAPTARQPGREAQLVYHPPRGRAPSPSSPG
jgi:hypothetical protein